VLIQLAGDPLHIDATHPAAVAEVDAVIHTQRLGGDEVAAHHADAGPLHGGVGEAHGELGGDVVLQTAAHLLDDGETGIVGDPDPLVILGLDAGAGQGLVILRTRTKHQYQDGFPADHQDEGGTPVHIDIGGGLPKGMDQAGFAFTHVFHSIKKQQFAQYMKINSQIKTKYRLGVFLSPF